MRVTDLRVDSSGSVYYATYGEGIQILKGGDWQPLYLESDQLASNFVEDLDQDRDGKMWIATDLGAHRLDAAKADEQWEIFKGGEGGPPSSWFQGIFPDPRGGLWFAHDAQRASYFDGSAWQPYASDQGIKGSVNAIAASDDGTIWIGTSEGLIIMDSDSTRMLTDTDGLPAKTVRALLLDGDTLWIGTTDGLARLVNGNLEVVLGPNASGLPDDNIGVIVKHPDGSLLLGTPEGLARYDGSQATTILEPEPLRTMIFGMTTQTISDIAVDPSGTIWATTYVGLYYGDGQTWQRFSTEDGLPTNNLNTVYIDQLGTIWVGGGYTDGGGGIARYVPGGELTTASPEPVIQVTQVTKATQAAVAVGGVIYDEITGLPMLPDAEDIYADKDSVLNYWTPSFLETARDFYLGELPKVGWLLDLDENGKCRDNDRCMGWHGGYDAPDTSTWFFIQGEDAYLTLNLIEEGVRVNVILSINMEYK
jgi:ligand-binding sensor domain-containing protein